MIKATAYLITIQHQHFLYSGKNSTEKYQLLSSVLWWLQSGELSRDVCESAASVSSFLFCFHNSIVASPTQRENREVHNNCFLFTAFPVTTVFTTTYCILF